MNEWINSQYVEETEKNNNLLYISLNFEDKNGNGICCLFYNLLRLITSIREINCWFLNNKNPVLKYFMPTKKSFSVFQVV